MEEKKDIKRYKCMNFGACAKADQGTIIEIDALETIGGVPDCPYCHQHTLEEQIEKTTNWKLFGGIAAAVVAVGVGVIIMFTGGKKKNEPIQTEPTTETVDTTKTDSAKIDSVKEPKTPVVNQGTDKPTPEKTKPQPQPTNYNMGWGMYEGPMEGGKPNGFGGSITVRNNYSIDLKKASGETVEVGPGDKIVTVKMENGRMRQGEIHFADGTRRFLSGL